MKKRLLVGIIASVIMASPAMAEWDHSTLDPSKLDKEELEDAYEDLRDDWYIWQQMYTDLLAEKYSSKGWNSGTQPKEAETDKAETLQLSLDDATQNMIEGIDEFTGDRSFYSKHTYKTTSDGTIVYKGSYPPMLIHLDYMAESGDLKYSVSFRYHGDDWIFFDKVRIKTGGQLYDIDLSGLSSHTDVKDGKVTERYSVWAGVELKDILNHIAENGEAAIRFMGSEGTKDYTASEDLIESIKETVDVYNSIAK